MLFQVAVLGIIQAVLVSGGFVAGLSTDFLLFEYALVWTVFTDRNAKAESVALKEAGLSRRNLESAPAEDVNYNGTEARRGRLL